MRPERCPQATAAQRRVDTGARGKTTGASESRRRLHETPVLHLAAQGVGHGNVFGLSHEWQRRLELVLVLPAQQIEEIRLAALIAMRTSTGPGSGVGNCVHDRAFGLSELSR